MNHSSEIIFNSDSAATTQSSSLANTLSGANASSSCSASDTEQTIFSLIAAQAEAHPDRIAVYDGTQSINYHQLLTRADAIAATLVTQGVTEGSLVGVCMNRSWELVATLLGVLRARCAYVPLDPAYPRERVRYMLEHSRAAAVVVDQPDSAALCAGVAVCITLDSVQNQTLSHYPKPRQSDLAYVIYTSGSTGQPKGVAVGHDNLVSLHNAMNDLFKPDERQGFLAAASVCFDTSVLEILGSLSLGSSIVLADNALQLPKLPFVDKISTCVMVPSAMQALLATDPLPTTIRCVVFGGEALKLPLVKQIHELPQQPRVLNFYGPTEDTVFSTTCEIPRDATRVPIGTSVPNSCAYILDENMNRLSAGIPGELYLAGDKVARGYLYDETRTRERFIVPDSQSALPKTRLYKTGDLCQWSEDGDIEFLGRVDQQVKVRGFRIELGEIESVLETMPAVDAAAAAAWDAASGQKVLVAYIIADKEALAETEITAFLSNRLPSYMVPKHIMFLDALPLLPNDKLDRRGLPDLESVRRAALQQDLEPTQPTALIALIQREVADLLHIEDPGLIAPARSFESTGLDSLTIPELSSRIGQALGRKISVAELFEHPTPASLAQHLSQAQAAQTETDVSSKARVNSLADFQSNIQSSHPTFQAAKAATWSATDKAKLVQEVMKMVNTNRRNPYSKVIRTGSAGRGTVSDAYTDEEREAVIWTTNLYLGLNRDPAVIEASRNALENLGTGMGTSAAASGLTDLHLTFEKEFAALTGKASACLFPTGYTANVGVIAGLLGKNDVVVLDQLCHASIVDGARLCGASIRTFKHNDPQDLDRVLKSEASPYRTVLVVLEGVYSMGEGAAPVAEIVHTAKQHGALVLVDEAHSFGFYGERGAGICADQGVTDQVDFIMTTLSKALGSLGGVIAASREHVSLLKSSSRAYIFQASISPADMAAALTALRRLSTDDTPRRRLWETTRYMRAAFTEAGYDLGTGDGPIVTPHFSDKDKLYALVQGMYQRGVQTSAVTYPIVEPGRGRLRLICSAAHTREDVDKTLAALIDAEHEYDNRTAAPAKEAGDDGGVAEVEGWLAALSAFVKPTLEAASCPDLAVTVRLAEEETPVTFAIREGVVHISDEPITDLPTCTLQLNSEAVAALCRWDVQALLQHICDGGCLLNGQIEPFIWLIGRLVDHQPSATMIAC